MKTMSKKLMSIATTVAVSVSVLSSFASVNAATINKENVVEKATAAETRGKYATNPNGVGKEKTITIDGDVSDWSDDMLIAQGAAWDIANNWKGGHENCVLDSYALYAAWDNENLYIGWQMVNTTDTWANSGDGPLSDGGRVLDVPLVIALNVGNKTAMNGKMANGKLIWDALQVEYETRVDHLFLMSGKPGLGTPAMFTAADASGGASYDAEYCQSFKETGIQYKMAETSIPTQIWGLAGSDSPDDVYSDSANWVDMMTKGHDRKYDSFYEMSIPLSVLGIDKSYITSNGIGVMQISTRGVSAIDCLPHDPSMLDNATEECAVDPSTSHEKDDTDVITVPLAQIGNNGGVTPPPVTSGTVVVKYVDESGNEIASSKTLTGSVGSSYTTSAATISGYTLKETPNNATGTYKSGTITVTYVYSQSGITPPVEEGTVIAKYVDEYGNEIASQITKTGEVGTSYTTTAKAISGYTLMTTPSNATGTFRSGTITVRYIYSSNDIPPIEEGKVTVKYIDKDTGEEIKESTIKTGEVGTSYTTTAPTIPGYTLTTTPYNASGTFRDGNIIVTYYYVASGQSTNPLVVNSFTVDKASPQATGTKVTLKATASGTGLQYKFLIRDAQGNYFVIKNYSTSNTATWTTGAIGNKTLYVDVKDSTGKVVRKEMAYSVTNPLTVSSFTVDKASPQPTGTEVTLKATASGTGLQYKFLIRDDKGNYFVIKNYSTSNTATWTTGAIGNKTLYVDVKDSTGKVVRKEMAYVVKSAIIEENNSGIYYTGTWETAKGTNYSSGSCKYTQKAATATFNFTGTGIKVIGNKAPTSGIAKITIDGKAYYVDLYNSSITCKNSIFIKTGLTSGTHTIKIEWTGLKNSASKGTTINLDAFEIIK